MVATLSPLPGAERITFLAPWSRWPWAAVFRGEQTGALEHHVDAELTPRHGGGAILDAEHLDLVAVDDEDVVFGDVGGGLLRLDGAGEAALGGVVLEEVGEVVGGHQVVDGNDVELGAEVSLLDESAEHEASDPAESINGNVGHGL
jgi:hypothetical protein